MAFGVGRPWRRAQACSACVPLLVLYTAMRVIGADTAKNMYIEDTDRFPGWKGELPRSAEEDGPNTIGYGEGGVVSSFTALATSAVLRGVSVAPSVMSCSHSRSCMYAGAGSCSMLV